MWLCFFFSSRRRHTRWPRDWSSDVCSSDLVVTMKLKVFSVHNQANRGFFACTVFSVIDALLITSRLGLGSWLPRSRTCQRRYRKTHKESKTPSVRVLVETK